MKCWLNDESDALMQSYGTATDCQEKRMIKKDEQKCTVIIYSNPFFPVLFICFVSIVRAVVHYLLFQQSSGIRNKHMVRLFVFVFNFIFVNKIDRNIYTFISFLISIFYQFDTIQCNTIINFIKH